VGHMLITAVPPVSLSNLKKYTLLLNWRPDFTIIINLICGTSTVLELPESYSSSIPIMNSDPLSKLLYSISPGWCFRKD
jgi:hypothetical protein